MFKLLNPIFHLLHFAWNTRFWSETRVHFFAFFVCHECESRFTNTFVYTIESCHSISLSVFLLPIPYARFKFFKYLLFGRAFLKVCLSFVYLRFGCLSLKKSSFLGVDWQLFILQTSFNFSIVYTYCIFYATLESGGSFSNRTGLPSTHKEASDPGAKRELRSIFQTLCKVVKWRKEPTFQSKPPKE